MNLVNDSDALVPSAPPTPPTTSITTSTTNHDHPPSQDQRQEDEQGKKHDDDDDDNNVVTTKITTTNGNDSIFSSSSSSSSSRWNTLFWIETKILLQLAIPTIVINLSFVIPPFLTASYVGRNFGYLHLDGYSLANLTGNILTLALLQGFFNSCDTLSPQAYCLQNYYNVGLIMIRGFVSTMIIILPMNVLLFYNMDRMLQYFKQDALASQYAKEFYRIYSISFPFYSMYTLMWKFLSSQHILLPLVVCTIISTFIVLPICLHAFTNYVGYVGAAWSITICYVIEATSIILYCFVFQPHHPETWPDVFKKQVWIDAMEWKSYKSFLILSIGGMLASFEWVYWEALALIIGSLGVLPLSAHTVPTQIMFFGFMIPLGLGIALAIRLGSLISKNVQRARYVAMGTCSLGGIFFAIISIVMYYYRNVLYNIFTKEKDVIDLCEQIWFHVCLYFFLLSFFGIINGLCIGLGMQWTLGIITLISLWCFGLPASYYFAVIQNGGLEAAWVFIWPPYLIIDIYMLFSAFIVADWDQISTTIRIREGLVNDEINDDDDLESLTLIESVDHDMQHQQRHQQQQQHHNNNNNSNNNNIINKEQKSSSRLDYGAINSKR